MARNKIFYEDTLRLKQNNVLSIFVEKLSFTLRWMGWWVKILVSTGCVACEESILDWFKIQNRFLCWLNKIRDIRLDQLQIVATIVIPPAW